MFHDKAEWYYWRLVCRAWGEVKLKLGNIAWDIVLSVAAISVMALLFALGDRNLDFQSAWIVVASFVVVAVVVIVGSLLTAPVRLDQDAKSKTTDLRREITAQGIRIGALEDERKVKLVVEGSKLDGFSISQDGAVLNIDSDGLDHVQDCTVHVLEVLWEVGGIYRNGVLQKADWKSMFQNEDIYLHWHNKDAAVSGLTFKGAAVALVAWRQVQIDRRYRLGSVGGKTYHLQSGTCVLAVEVGARNAAYQSCAFKISVPFGDNEEMRIEKMAWHEKPTASF